jgi:hypothetical protein
MGFENRQRGTRCSASLDYNRLNCYIHLKIGVSTKSCSCALIIYGVLKGALPFNPKHFADDSELGGKTH